MMDAPREVGDDAEEEESYEEMKEKLWAILGEEGKAEFQAIEDRMTGIEDGDELCSFLTAHILLQEERTREVELELVFANSKVRKYQIAMIVERYTVLGIDSDYYEEWRYVEFMKKKFGEDAQEVNIERITYRIFQYLIHLAPESSTDKFIKPLRQKYGGDRNSAHHFCLHMDKSYRTLSDVITQKFIKSDREFTVHRIIDELEKLHLQPSHIESLKTLLEFAGVDP